MICIFPPVNIASAPDRASDSANQRIYRILHSCRRRICLSPVHGGLYSRILMGLGTMAIAYCYAKKHNYPVCPKVSASEAVRITLDAIPSLLLIVIVIGGIVGGIFTATEGAGICVLYCLIPHCFTVPDLEELL